MTAPANDRRVLLALQALLLAVPLFLGGRHPLAISLGLAAALALVAATLHARRRAGGGPAATGVGALAAFGALALVTTIPLPPALFSFLSPSAARLTADMLPGWPEVGAFSRWRPLALDAYAVWVELGRLALGFAVFATIVAYPWRAGSFDEPRDERVLTRLVPTLVIGAAVLAALGLLAEAVGNGRVLWITDEPTVDDRVSGPFVNPNHFAAWLAMAIPLTLAYAVALASRLRRRLARAVEAGRGMGVRRERSWATALIANQRALALPLAAAAGTALLVVALVATGSRGGLAALLVGLGIAGAGLAARTRRQGRTGRLGRFGRFAPAALALALVAGAAVTLVRWAATEDLADDGLDVNLASRLTVAAQGAALLRDYPLVGSGLGSWLHAYRPYQAPPVEGGIWDHAHDDYLELAAETGVAGVAIVVAFFVLVGRALLADRRARRAAAAERAERRPRGRTGPPAFAAAEWRAALRARGHLRWGLVGGIAAILAQSFVDFGLHLPANFLLLMTLGGLLVTTGRPRPAPAAAFEEEPPLIPEPANALPRPFSRRAAGTPALAALFAVLAVAAAFQAANAVLVVTDATPLAPAAALARADRVLAEGAGDAAALRLVRSALDWSPADRAAHEAEAAVLGAGPDAEAAWRRAIALSPWAPELRDGLALALWRDDRRDAALAEIEESMLRYPYLVSHAYLSPASDVGGRGAREWLRVLAEGDTLAIRLAALDDDLAGAIRRGLERALAATADGPVRSGIVDDLATLLEARERFADAAAMLRAEAERSEDGRASLARAARAALRARDLDGAEATLLAALTRTPEQGRLYRDLALDVYAARGDFETAETVLRAGERNAVDLLPIHRGVSELVVRRETSRRREAATPPAAAEGAAAPEQAVVP
ncbi:MAG: O-antigen ligase family protein [Deltaproteobacteria bacterium]|nr:O-antigen ligase family protein [Deltaproteobacteria bacterium]